MKKSELILPTALLALTALLLSGCSHVSGPRTGYRVFDVHLHALDPEELKHYATVDFGAHRKTFRQNVTDPEVLLQKTIEYLDRNRVEKSLLSGPPALVKSWVARHPGRFLPALWPDETLADQREAAKQFEQEVKEGKWRALGELLLPYNGLPLNDTRMFPFYEVCERNGIPVFFHTGLDGPEPRRLGGTPHWRVELGDPLLLQDVVERFPNLKVVIMHMGWPFFDHALYMLYTYPNVYMDVAVVNWILGRRLFDRMLAEAVDTVGSDRILFGSDQMVWPQMITPAVKAITHAKYLTDADKRRILWDNAAKLLRVNE